MSKPFDEDYSFLPLSKWGTQDIHIKLGPEKQRLGVERQKVTPRTPVRTAITSENVLGWMDWTRNEIG